MTGAYLILAAALGLTGGSDAEGLVAGLGSPRYAARERAAGELERLGRGALPALRAAREQSRDPEIRARAATLIGRIEATLMVRPTLVRLDFRDRPLSEAVSELSARAEIPMALVPDNPGLWQSRRVTVLEPGPVPFWAALDRLARAGQVQYNVAVGAAPDSGQALVQFFAGTQPVVPVSDSGPFRVSLQGIHLHRDLAFGQRNEAIGLPAGVRAPAPDRPEGPDHTSVEQLYLDFQVAVEPRMIVSQAGPLKLIEATDDAGNSLLPLPESTAAQPYSAGYLGFNGASQVIMLQAYLRPLRGVGGAIARFRGAIPLAVFARKGNPLVVRLDEAEGKTFRTEAAALTIHSVKPVPEQPGTAIDLSVRSLDPSDAAGGGLGRELIAFRSGIMPQSQIELLDARGRAYVQWFPSSTQIDDEEVRVTLRLMPGDNLGPPATLRYHDMARAEAEAAFDFANVPMP